MQIRMEAPADAADIAILTAQLGYPVSEAEIGERVENLAARDDNRLFVCELDQRIGGLVVAEELRNQGIGGALLKYSEDWVKLHGLDTVLIRSNVVRQQAHEFYLGQGYLLMKNQRVFRKVLVE
jgi:GNAT superfamily N-acetyltransferase